MFESEFPLVESCWKILIFGSRTSYSSLCCWDLSFCWWNGPNLYVNVIKKRHWYGNPRGDHHNFPPNMSEQLAILRWFNGYVPNIFRGTPQKMFHFSCSQQQCLLGWLISPASSLGASLVFTCQHEAFTLGENQWFHYDFLLHMQIFIHQVYVMNPTCWCQLG